MFREDEINYGVSQTDIRPRKKVFTSTFRVGEAEDRMFILGPSPDHLPDLGKYGLLVDIVTRTDNMF